jgi:hypothetical protein
MAPRAESYLMERWACAPRPKSRPNRSSSGYQRDLGKTAQAPGELQLAGGWFLRFMTSTRSRKTHQQPRPSPDPGLYRNHGGSTPPRNPAWHGPGHLNQTL